MHDKKYIVIEHTADSAIKVFGRNFEELFVNAIYGLFELINFSFKIFDDNRYDLIDDILIEDESIEGLLIQFLNEFIFRFYTQLKVPCRIFDLSVAKGELRARIGFRKEKSIEEANEVKSATYHDLNIKKTEKGYQCRIIFDI